MHILPLRTGILDAKDDLPARLLKAGSLQTGDIVVVSSKAVATTEGAAMRMADDANAFREAVLKETDRLHGTVLPGCTQAMLCELRPEGLHTGTILAANAGLDRSNVETGHVVGWPKDPVLSVRNVRAALERASGARIGVIISDSCCKPRRQGVTAYALTVSGFSPIISRVNEEDLFGRKLRMTQEAVADQLATAANFVMGNGAEATPAAIVRDHGLALSDFEGWVPGIEPSEDLFGGV